MAQRSAVPSLPDEKGLTLEPNPYFLEWDEDDWRQVEEAKLLYRAAKNGGRLITDIDGNVVTVFKPFYQSLLIGPYIQKVNELSFFILNETGDETIVWDLSDTEEVKEAAAKFYEYVQKGWKAYAISSDGKHARRVLHFDAQYQEVTFQEIIGGGVKEKLDSFVKSFTRVSLLPKTRPG